MCRGGAEIRRLRGSARSSGKRETDAKSSNKSIEEGGVTEKKGWVIDKPPERVCAIRRKNEGRERQA